MNVLTVLLAGRFARMRDVANSFALQAEQLVQGGTL